jgi:hypothetical protein
MKVNYFTNVKQPVVYSSTTETEWFNMIKESSHSELIKKARASQVDYEKTKFSLPCITYNFLFKEKKTNDNIIAPTGLMYIDIDDNSFNPDILPKDKVLAYYRSFGGLGWGIIVRVNGLSLENFKATYLSICDNLGISSYIDRAAIKATQYNVLSYDPNIFINYFSIPFTSINEKVTSTSQYKKEGERCCELDVTICKNKFRVSNKQDFSKVEGGVTIYKDGIDIIELKANKIKDGNRNQQLFLDAIKLYELNPWMEEGIFIEKMMVINNVKCIQPITEEEIRKICTSVINGNYTSFNKTKKFIVFDNQNKASKEEKLSEAGKIMGEIKRDRRKQNIYNAIEEMMRRKMKITISEVAEFTSSSDRTIKRYWDEFKGIVKEHNDSIKSDLMNVKPITVSTIIEDEKVSEIEDNDLKIEIKGVPLYELILACQKFSNSDDLMDKVHNSEITTMEEITLQGIL